MLSLKKTTFQTTNKKSPVQISRFFCTTKNSPVQISRFFCTTISKMEIVQTISNDLSNDFKRF